MKNAQINTLSFDFHLICNIHFSAIKESPGINSFVLFVNYN